MSAATEPGQISVFDLLGERRTPLLRPEDARAGMFAYMMEPVAYRYGPDDDRIRIVYLRAIRVKLTADPHTYADGKWGVCWQSDDVGTSCGGAGWWPTLYVRRPGFDELLRDFWREHERKPEYAGAPVVP